MPKEGVDFVRERGLSDHRNVPDGGGLEATAARSGGLSESDGAQESAPGLDLRNALKASEAENERLRQQLARLHAQEPLLQALDTLAEAIVIYDSDGRLIACNENFRQLYGYSEQEARAGVHFSELGRIDVERGNVSIGKQFEDKDDYLQHKARYRERLEGSFVVELKDGRWIRTTDRRTSDGGFASVQIDVTEIKALEQQMRHMALHDELTGLANRRLFAEQGGHVLATAQRNGSPCSLLYIDIDRFKAINDSHGHSTGDALLAAVAGRMRARLRASDLIARFGGDEFVVLLPSTGKSQAGQVAQTLIEVLSEPFQLGEVRLPVSASIGVADFPDTAQDLEGLLSKADEGLYRAKKEGRNRWRESPSD